MRLTFLALLPLAAPALAQIGNSPADEFSSFKLAPGFEVNLFADETQGVIKPIQMRWDERGRLWVIGSKTYPQIKPGEEPDGPGGGARRHESRWQGGQDDGLRGRADDPHRAGDRAGNGPRRGVLRGRGHEALADDRHGWRRRADKREVVLRGFGTGDNHQNINSFRWSPGGELVFCQGLHAHSRVETPWGISTLD